MKIENFEFLEESNKAWYIAKLFFPVAGDPEYRWIPKSVSVMNEQKTVIEIADWFYKVWMKEIEQKRNNFDELQITLKNQVLSREVLKETELYIKAENFVNYKISDTGLTKGFSDTRTIFYLGEFANHIFSQNKDINILIFNHRLRELLDSNKNYKDAYDFLKSRRISIVMPKEKELIYLMAEFIENLIKQKNNNI